VIEKDTAARHPAVAKVVDRPQLGIDWDAAALPTPLEPTEQQYAVAEIAVFLGYGAELLPGVGDLREVPFNALASQITSPSTVLGKAGNHSKSRVKRSS
jgi:hypothetical protein